jgi:hypothetical protein
MACGYGGPAGQAGRNWREVALSWLGDVSFRWVLGKQGTYGGDPRVT